MKKKFKDGKEDWYSDKKKKKFLKVKESKKGSKYGERY